ncbi:MAG: hypothetical protein IPM29_28430 [Planctomycetes bacterium]|nr:hypothetical protein [Planctomycetota bacterium]
MDNATETTPAAAPRGHRRARVAELVWGLLIGVGVTLFYVLALMDAEGVTLPPA